MLIHWSKITPRFFTDPLGLIEDAPICNAGVFRDLTQCGDVKYKIFVFWAMAEHLVAELASIKNVHYQFSGDTEIWFSSVVRI